MAGMFRNLRADEIDCRIGSISEKGLSLLLYKDARCDMNILDETFGPFGWQRHHSRDNANCVVSVYDEQKNEWIEKEDTGTESNTEAEKGLASDSFKRACFNWGIGRELYTAPFIWINAEKCEIKKNDKGRMYCNDKFHVSEISYNERGEIVNLIISNKDVDVFTFSRRGASSARQTQTAKDTADVVKTQHKAIPGPDGKLWCESCNKEITTVKVGGELYDATRVADRGLAKHGKQLCWACQKAIEMPVS